MKQCFYLFKRNRTYYIQDGTTGKQQSLKTKDKSEAQKILHAKNESAHSSTLNVALAKVYLSAHDGKMFERTWQDVTDEFCNRGNADTQKNRRRIANRKPQCRLRNLRLVETKPDDFLNVLKAGGVMTNSYVRCLHNLALGLGWLPWPILPQKLWPSVVMKEKRGITSEEHQRIIAAETNVERRRYYEMLWEIGAAQTDAALLRAECVDWQRGILSYQRKKNGQWAHLQIGEPLKNLLRQLPSSSFLFPKIALSNNSARSSEFCRRCRLLKIKGVSLHSYRYAWAERAQACGYPQRWAQNALGHDSRAVHQSYARRGIAICPPLNDYETIAKNSLAATQSYVQIENRQSNEVAVAAG